MKRILPFLAVLILVTGYGGETMSFTATQRTTSAFDKGSAQLQVIGDTIYFVWVERDAALDTQIWTATMKIDGSGFSETKKTNIPLIHSGPQLQVVVGDKIYYVYIYNKNLWTATMNIDGTGWAAVEKRNGAGRIHPPQFQVVGNKIYYVWDEFVGGWYQIFTGSMNTDGTGWVVTQQTFGNFYRYYPELQVVDDIIIGTADATGANKLYDADGGFSTSDIGKIVWNTTDNTYTTVSGFVDSGELDLADDIMVNGEGYTLFFPLQYVYYADDDGTYNIYTATSNLDGSGWAATQRTFATGVENQRLARLQVVGDTIYYAWEGRDATLAFHFCTASMKTDGSGWTDTMHADYARNPNQEVVAAASKIYYVYNRETPGGDYGVFTAEMNMDGTGYIAVQRTFRENDLEEPQMDVSGDFIYYIWNEYIPVPNYRQLWTGRLAVPLVPEALEAGDLHTFQPFFSAIYRHPDAEVRATSYQIQVSISPDFLPGEIVWDSEEVSMPPLPDGGRAPDIDYGGEPLGEERDYYWRIRFWDEGDDVGPWSNIEVFRISPGEPYDLLCEQKKNPTDVQDPYPEFSAKNPVPKRIP